MGWPSFEHSGWPGIETDFEGEGCMLPGVYAVWSRRQPLHTQERDTLCAVMHSCCQGVPVCNLLVPTLLVFVEFFKGLQVLSLAWLAAKWGFGVEGWCVATAASLANNQSNQSNPITQFRASVTQVTASADTHSNQQHTATR